MSSDPVHGLICVLQKPESPVNALELKDGGINEAATARFSDKTVEQKQ